VDKGKRVLAVDDDEDYREGLTYLLDDLGYSVTAAADGREALQSLKDDPRPDVILVDLRMPGMNGEEFLEEQARDADLASIPFVVVSGARDVEEKARALGAAGVLAKPFGLRSLLDSIDKATEP